METIHIPCDKENLPIQNHGKGVENLKLARSPSKTANIDENKTALLSSKKRVSSRVVLGDITTPTHEPGGNIKSSIYVAKLKSLKSNTAVSPLITNTPKTVLDKSAARKILSKVELTPKKHKFAIRADSPDKKIEQNSDGRKLSAQDDTVTLHSKCTERTETIIQSPVIPTIIRLKDESDSCVNESEVKKVVDLDIVFVERTETVIPLPMVQTIRKEKGYSKIDTPTISLAISAVVKEPGQDVTQQTGEEQFIFSDEANLEISKFIDIVLHQCLEDVLEYEVGQEDEMPSIKIIPPTPVEIDDNNPTSAEEPSLSFLSPLHNNISTVLNTTDAKTFQTCPMFDLNKDDIDIFIETCGLSDSQLVNISHLSSNLSGYDFNDIFLDSEDDSDKENISPPKTNSFNSLRVNCDIDYRYDPPYRLSFSEDGDTETVENTNVPLFSPSFVCSPTCYKNYQQSNPNRTVLGLLPVPQNEDQSNDSANTSFESPEEDASSLFYVQDNLLNVVPNESVNKFTFDAALCDSKPVSVDSDRKIAEISSTPQTAGFQVYTDDAGCSPIRVPTSNTSSSPFKTTQTSIETNTEILHYANISMNTDSVDSKCVGISPFKQITKEVEVMTENNSMLNKSMETEHADVVDRSMITQSDCIDSCMMTESIVVCNAETDMTPLKLLNKRGKRISAEEVRRQHPRTIANQIDTTLVSNEKLQAEVKTVTKENTRLKTVIKDLKQNLSKTKKQLEDYDVIQKVAEQRTQTGYDDKIENLNAVIRNKDQLLTEKIEVYNELWENHDTLGKAYKTRENEMSNSQQVFENKLKQQSNEHAHKMKELKLTELKYKEESDTRRKIVEEQEERIECLSDVIKEAEILMKQQNALKTVLYDLVHKVKTTVNSNVSEKQQLQLQWTYLEDKKMRVDVEVEACKMNNKLLLQECEELRESLTAANKNVEELEMKYFDAEKDLMSAASKLDMAKRELDFSRTTIYELGSLEDDLSTAYTEIEMLQSTLQQTQDTLQHEQLRYTGLHDEYSSVKEQLEDQLKQSENLVMNLQRTVDFREVDVEKLENKLLENYNFMEAQKDKLENLEEQLFNCREEVEQKNDEISTMKENEELLLGERNICLQSALELEEKVKSFESQVTALELINTQHEAKHSQLFSTHTQLENDYLLSRQKLKEARDNNSTVLQQKDEEIQQAKDYLTQLDNKMISYINKLKHRINEKEANRRKQFKQTFTGLSSSLEELGVTDHVSIERNVSVLGPNAKPHRYAASLSPDISAFPPVKNQSTNSWNTSVYNHVTSQTTTPAKSSPYTEMYLESCKKLRALVDSRCANHVSPSVSNRRQLNFNQTLNMSDDHVKDFIADIPVSDNNQSVNMSLSNSMTSANRSISPNCDSLSDLVSKVEKRFEEVTKLISALEKMSSKSTQNLLSDKEDLESTNYKLEKQIQHLRTESAFKSEAVSQANQETVILGKKLQELTDCMVKYSDQQEKIKTHERENKKFLAAIQKQQDEIKLLTEELDILCSRTSGINGTGTDNRPELFDLKRKNQQLRMKILEDYNVYAELETKAKGKIRNLEENWMQSKAEACRYSELVDTIKDTLNLNKTKLEEIPSLHQLLNIINGSDVCATPAKNSFHSFYDSFMF